MLITFRNYTASLLTLLTLLVSLTRADVVSELASLGFKTVTSSTSTYSDAISVWSKRITYKPVVVTYPRNTKDVSDIVQISSRYNYTVTARSGGHNYIANAMAGKIVVDLAAFDTVAVNSTTQVATIGPGIRLGNLLLELNKVGRAMPHGLCPYVALGGHAAHGGYGFTSRQWGLAMDVVESLEVVLANGTIATASATNNTDLFWALQGAASSYGIITSVKAKTFPVPQNVTSMKYAWDMSIDEATSAVLDWQSFSLAATTPAEIGVYLILQKGRAKGRINVSYMGSYYGNNSTYADVVQPLFKNHPSGGTRAATATNYVNAALIAGQNNLLNTTGTRELGSSIYAKSLMTPEGEPMTETAVRNWMTYLSDAGYSANVMWIIEIEQYGGVNSVINKVPLGATAFGRRDALFTIQFLTVPIPFGSFPDSGYNYFDGMVSSLVDKMPSTWDYGAYINYPDERLSNWQHLYYGAQYNRLQSLKAIYDPSNTFKFPLSIELPT